jgi:hypothetical protein
MVKLTYVIGLLPKASLVGIEDKNYQNKCMPVSSLDGKK